MIRLRKLKPFSLLIKEWLASLEPIVGHSLFSPARRAQLKRDQQRPRASPRKRRAAP